ncbi:MAG: phytanoyl-CoA dioxygenase family protein [Chitinophagales bacterium]|nr:phytanoyl-CoA dioxygenase family protein [Chitinophagales bacterium]
MNYLFLDKDLDSKLKEQGYIKFDFLKKEKIDEILKVYSMWKITDENTYNDTEKVETLTGNDFDALYNILNKIVSPSLSRHCPELRTLFVEFLVKKPGKSNIPGHQDWLFTDRESLDTPSLSLFIALGDIRFENGALGLVPCSHKMKDLTPPPSPAPYAPIPLLEHEQLVFEYMTFEEMKAGQAIVFFNNIIHGSYDNISDSDRPLLRFALYHKDSDLYHYYMHPDSTPNKVEMIQYKVNSSFFAHNRNEVIINKYFKKGLELPELEIKREIYLYPTYTHQELEQELKNIGAQRNQYDFSDEQKNQEIEKKTWWKRLLKQ